MVEALNLALLILSQVLNPVLVSPSSSMRQEGGFGKEKVFRTNDYIPSTQLSSNALIFCPRQPDYSSWFKPELTMFYRDLLSDDSPLLPQSQALQPSYLFLNQPWTLIIRCLPRYGFHPCFSCFTLTWI